MKAHRKSITIWNIAALAVMVIGASSTLLAAHVWMAHWAGTGVHLPVGQRTRIALPAGETMVFYESLYTVPSSLASLHIVSPEGERIHPETFDGDDNYRIRGSGLSGRALWRVYLPIDGIYDIGCYNSNYLSNDAIPADDRVAMFKEPNTLHAAGLIQTGIHIGGGTITVVFATALYTLHALSLKRRRLHEADSDGMEPRTEKMS